jgi:hypothetical protein
MSQFYLLDAGGPLLLIGPLVIFMFCIVLVEAVIMFFMKMNRFLKCVGDSILANLGSLLIGVLLFFIGGRTEIELSFWVIFAGLYVITVVSEAIFLKWLNKEQSWKRVFIISVIMNMASYLILYFFKSWF